MQLFKTIRTIAVPLMLLGLPAYTQSASGQEVTAEEQAAYDQWAENFMESLTLQTGTITLPGGLARLEQGDQFYYLSPDDAERVLQEAWGNPPGNGGLGMIFPYGYRPVDDTVWAVTIAFEELGYVEDKDAADIDYDGLLQEMIDDARAENDWRTEEGYEPFELIGWASAPYYDSEAKKLHWAKEIHFGGADENTLNYNVRILGRKGVLVLNFVAGMGQLDEIQNAIPDVLAMTNFEPGHTYADFNPSMDEVATVGIAGLIAGKVIAKTGLLAAALIALKKFWFLVAAAFFGLWKRLSGRRSN